MFRLVAQEFWRRHKLKVICFGLWIVLMSVMYATGWIWDIENWARPRIGNMNPIVLFSLLIAIGMTVDAHRRRSRG